MSQFQWTYDAPTGVYKNHDLSEKLREAAIAETKFMQFVSPEPGYGKKQGESVTLTRVSNISVPTNARLNENQKIPEDEVTLSTVAITVSEWGRAVPYTNLAQQLSMFDPEGIIQKQLKNQMKLVMDAAAATAFKAGQIDAVMTGVSSVEFTTDGSPDSSAAANLNVYGVEEIRDYMYDTLKIPPFIGDDYVGIISTGAKRGIMRDPNWEDWKKYTDPSAKFNAEVGRLENIRFIESNNSNALDGTIGTGGICGEGVFFGEDAVVMAVVEDPELRMKAPEDYGRSKGVAWYGILEFGQPWGDSANAGEARVVHLSST